jgi:hypothetical protein
MAGGGGDKETYYQRALGQLHWALAPLWHRVPGSVTTRPRSTVDTSAPCSTRPSRASQHPITRGIFISTTEHGKVLHGMQTLEVGCWRSTSGPNWSKTGPHS